MKETNIHSVFLDQVVIGVPGLIQVKQIHAHTTSLNPDFKETSGSYSHKWHLTTSSFNLTPWAVKPGHILSKRVISNNTSNDKESESISSLKLKKIAT